ncbi:MAG: hypothetical protein EB127_06855 [Alphaproteobacteria bacterium]|nr:hypothetical protein [Alphaproteobacteria bacterium]
MPQDNSVQSITFSELETILIIPYAIFKQPHALGSGYLLSLIVILGQDRLCIEYIYYYLTEK